MSGYSSLDILSDDFCFAPAKEGLMELVLERRPDRMDAPGVPRCGVPIMTFPGFASPKAIARFRLLEPHLKEGVPLARIAAECGMSERTLRRWLTAWRTNGIEGLERARRSDAGAARKLAPDMEAYVRDMATRRPRPTAAAIHRKVQAEAKARGPPP